MFSNLILLANNGFWPYLRDNSDDFGVFLRIGNFEIRWYAICILIGALLVLLRCRYELKKHGLPKDYYDNLFISILIIGVIGCRVWYVISSPDEFSNFAEMIGFSNGGFHLSGLAIQGGVTFGLIWFLIYFNFIKKDYPIGFHFDLIAPGLFIGQIVGRWGNFFNGEVYGKVVSRSSLWWIPNFIINNCTTASIGSQAGYESVHLPLFFIEMSLNLIGFILIGYVLWRFWKGKTRKPFCVGSFYFIYYGVVRLILEPLREQQYIMTRTFFGIEVRTSIMMSILFIVGGVITFIIAQIIYRKVPYEKIYVNDKLEQANLKSKQEEQAEIDEMIANKKAEILARKGITVDSSTKDTQVEEVKQEEIKQEIKEEKPTSNKKIFKR